MQEADVYLKFLLNLRKFIRNREGKSILRYDEVIRVEANGRIYCPLTFIVYKQCGFSLSPSRYCETSNYLNIDIYTIEKIARAADNHLSGNPEIKQIRKHLRYFMGGGKQ